MFDRHNSPVHFLVILGLVLGAALASGGHALAAAEDAELANELAVLLRSSRKVISQNQALINRPDIADKGLSADVVLEKTRDNFLEQTGTDLNSLTSTDRRSKLLLGLTEAIRAVMDEAQPLINDGEMGFKGFLPAVFAREVATAFNKIERDDAYIKLTAPKNYVRNRANRPDKWEHYAIEEVFKAPGHVTGASYSENAVHKGKPGFRLIIPEYYGESCLSCHGMPKGELDITGGKKEGGVLGELGGAISVVLYDTGSPPASP